MCVTPAPEVARLTNTVPLAEATFMRAVKVVPVSFWRFSTAVPAPPKVTVLEAVPIAPATVPVTVPLLMRRPPVNVFVPERVSAPVPFLVIPVPVPEITLSMVNVPVPL